MEEIASCTPCHSSTGNELTNSCELMMSLYEYIQRKIWATVLISRPCYFLNVVDARRYEFI